MKIWFIVVYLLNATTGEPEQEYRSQVPLTIEQCAQSLIDRGPVPVKDGQATVTVCKKITAEVRT